MKRFWCCRDLEGAANEEVFLFVGEEPPIMDDDGEWVDPRKEGLFWSEEDFNFDFDKLLGTVKFPELNKGERIEMNLQFEFGIKWLYEGSVTPVKYDDEWNTSDEETDDSTWIGEFDLRATYGVGFVESLPDIANGEMTEIRIKYTAEKCE